MRVAPPPPPLARRPAAPSQPNEPTLAGKTKGHQFQPGPEDVFIVSPPKCGTTWVCQIVQSLRSRGDMSFEEINLVRGAEEEREGE